jgi:hypothetical protein
MAAAELEETTEPKLLPLEPTEPLHYLKEKKVEQCLI